MQEFEKSITSLTRALNFENRNTVINYKIGLAARKIDRYEDAIEQFRIVEKNNVGRINIYNSLGSIYLDLNKINKAEKYFQMAVKFNPKDGSAHRHLSITKKYDKNDPHYHQMQKIFNSDLDKKEMSQLNFAISKYFHDTKEYQLAFKHYQNGNE